MFGLVLTINVTLLNSSFAYGEVQKLNVPAVVHELVGESTPSGEKYFISGIDKAISDIKPWLDQQIHNVIFSSYDYLSGRADGINVSIDTADIRQTLVKSLTTSYLENAPSQYTSLPADQKTRYLSDLQNQFLDAFPATVDINQDSIGESGMHTLQQIRTIVSYIHAVYFTLIVACVLFILAFILLQRKMRDIFRALGLVFLASGLVVTISFFIIRLVAPQTVVGSNLPVEIQNWVPRVIMDTISPLMIFGISLLATGLVVCVISFFLHRVDRPVSPRHSG